MPKVLGAFFLLLSLFTALFIPNADFMKWFPCAFMGLMFWGFSMLSNRRLLEEVIDNGEYLLLRGGGKTDLVKLDSIVAIRAIYRSRSWTPMLHLRLDKPGIFGDEVFFFPLAGTTSSYGSSFWQQRNAVEDNLIRRVDKARREMSGHLA